MKKSQKKLTFSLSVLAFTLLGLGSSAHAGTIISGAGFIPLSPVDAPSISYAQGAVTSTNANIDRYVTSDMGFFLNPTASFVVNIYFIGNGGSEFCFVDTREVNGTAHTYTLSRGGFIGPNTLSGPITNVVGGQLFVSLRCMLNHVSASGQTYIVGASFGT